MIETRNQTNYKPEIKPVLFSVHAWQSYCFRGNNFVHCGVSQIWIIRAQGGRKN